MISVNEIPSDATDSGLSRRCHRRHYSAGRPLPYISPSSCRNFPSIAAGPTRAHAASKRVQREYLDHGVRAADQLIPDVAAPLFESQDMQQGIVSLLEQGPGKAKFSGR